MNFKADAELVTYDNRFREAFASLNYRWIEAYFEVEDEDRKALENPEGYAIDPGGEIFFVLVAGEPVGTVAMVPHGPPHAPTQVFELAKMAVDPAHQGQGYRSLLMHACIDYARAQGAQEIMLVTNDVLAPAMGLYQSAGFTAVEIKDARYSRGNTEMRLDLSAC